MSLSSRLERAQQRAVAVEDEEEDEAPVAVAPAPPPPPVSPDRMAAREELMHSFRLRLQDEVMDAFGTLLDLANPEELRSKVEVIVERIVREENFAVTRDERTRLINDLVGEIGGLGPLDPLLSD